MTAASTSDTQSKTCEEGKPLEHGPRVAAWPKVSVILLNLNAYEDTRECLASLRKVEYPNLDIVLVDNGSTDGSFARLRSEFPDVAAHESKENLGFAGGNNLGIEHALHSGADYILLLNNDTVVDPGFLTHLVQAGEGDPGIAVLGPKILYWSDPERIWYAGGRMKYAFGTCRHLGTNEVDRDGALPGLQDTQFVTGCALMVKSSVVRQVGPLDARLFIYWEDTDFCSRVQSAGYRCAFVPTARVWHKISRTCGTQSPFTLYLCTRNQLAWVAKHVPFPYRPATLIFTLARKLVKGALLVPRSRASAAAVWGGVGAFLLGAYGPPPGGGPPGARAGETARRPSERPE